MSNGIRSMVGLAGGLLALVLLLPVNATAQSEFLNQSPGKFLEKNENGVGIGAGFATGGSATNFGGLLSYTHKGMLEVGAGLNRYQFDDQGAGLEMTSLQISPFANVHALKQSKDMPINLAFGGAYRSESYSSDAMDASGLELSSSGFVVGGMVYRSFQASKTVNIVPDAGVSYFSQTLKMTDTGTQTENEVDANVTLFSLGASVAAPLSSGNVLNFRAGADIPDEGDARFNAAIGFLLPINLSQ